MKLSEHIVQFPVSLVVFCERVQDPSLISKLKKKLFITNHMTLKPSIRSSFSKMRSKIHSQVSYSWIILLPLPTPPSNVIVRALNVSNCSTSAGSNSIQSEIEVLPLLTQQLLTQQKMRKRIHFVKNQNASTQLTIQQLHNYLVSN